MACGWVALEGETVSRPDQHTIYLVHICFPHLSRIHGVTSKVPTEWIFEFLTPSQLLPSKDLLSASSPFYVTLSQEVVTTFHLHDLEFGGHPTRHH